MPLLALLLAVAPQANVTPPCRPAQLRLSLQGGNAGGMSHDGVLVTIRNLGRDCMLPSLPRIDFADSRGRTVDAMRQAPIGMHPGPVMVPLHLAAGHRAATELRWVSGPVFDQSRRLHARQIVVEIAGGRLKSALRADLYGPAGKPIGFDQPPFQAVAGK